MSIAQVEKGGEESSQKKSSELEAVMYEDKDYVLHCYCQRERAGGQGVLQVEMLVTTLKENLLKVFYVPELVGS